MQRLSSDVQVTSLSVGTVGVGGARSLQAALLGFLLAERLARIKRRAVPDECFRDKELMSKWIDGNK